jgi:FkbM family methyltransferase
MINQNMITKVTVKAAAKVGAFLCKYRGLAFCDAIETAIDMCHRCLNNVNFDINQNGELRVLTLLENLKPKTVFDIGANIGEWSLTFSKIYPSCIIHAFEIVPSTYSQLVRNSKKIPNIILNNIGLSDKNEVISIKLSEGDTSTATACKIEGMKYHDEYYRSEIKCKVIKGVDYVNEKRISVIDFMKIDVEGMDLRVIMGFEDKIKNARAIQFEYGIFDIASHDLLSDFCRYLSDNEFVVGKIYPRHVSFFEYHFNKENFHGSNYIAIKKNETSLIRALTSRSVLKT